MTELAPSKNVPVGNVVDLFCGAGGLSHGFKQEGFQIAAGVDIDPHCRFPFERNNGGKFLEQDIAKISACDLEQFLPKDRPSVLIGCAPCQPFSPYGGRYEHDKRQWSQLGEFGRLVAALTPDIVSMENVPRLRHYQDGQIFSEFTDILDSTGYHHWCDTVYAPNFGVAQTRSRLVLIASRLGPAPRPVSSHPAKASRTVADEIGQLPRIEAGSTCSADPLHRASALSPRNIDRIRASKPHGTWRDWPSALRTDCHQRASGATYAAVYGRMSWDRPAPTITTQFYRYGTGRFGHPEQDRALSLREGALLQSFPPEYAFAASSSEVNFTRIGRLIGNAVPVRLARAVAFAVRQHLEARR